MMFLSVEHKSHKISGVILVALLAVFSMYVAEMPWLIKAGISSLVIAIIFGMIYGNTLRHTVPDQWMPGIIFSAKQLLRLAIILYGFRISFQQIISVGFVAIFLDCIVVAGTLMLGYWVGVKLLKLDRHLSLLISSGSAICGAAAVIAVEGVLKSEPFKASVGVGTVVLFGTIGMFLYPFLQHIGIIDLTDNQFGMFVGASVHEVAQALVAGAHVSEKAENIAVIVKMTRVLLLVPVLIFMSLFEKSKVASTETKRRRIHIPWFAIGFLAVIGFNSLNLLSPILVAFINKIDLFLLTMAMTAIGIETHFKKIKSVGLRPLYLALFLFVWLSFSVYTLIKFIL